MVVDMSLFTPYKSPLQANLLTVLEEMPGMVHSEDQTAHLEMYGYWASYNLPYYDDILWYSGAGALCKANPSLNCYSTDPRSTLFRAHQEEVTSLETFQTLMASNKYQTDPLSLGDPCKVLKGDSLLSLFLGGKEGWKNEGEGMKV